jgi:hypothetical protein
MAEQITKKRCAIYTRKSTDENLSSDFAVKNMDLLNDVINGVEGSLEEL